MFECGIKTGKGDRIQSSRNQKALPISIDAVYLMGCSLNTFHAKSFKNVLHCSQLNVVYLFIFARDDYILE